MKPDDFQSLIQEIGSFIEYHPEVHTAHWVLSRLFANFTLVLRRYYSNIETVKTTQCKLTKDDRQCGMIEDMKTPLFIRPLTENERSQIQAGLRSKGAFVLRRSQVLLASDRGERATAIAKQFGCHGQTVLNIIHGFNAAGLAVLEEGSSRPHRLRTTVPDETLEALRDLLHRSPRDFGLDTSVWTLSLAAQISFQQGLTPRLVSGESVRRALKRLGKNWKRAKHWITSPDPHYLVKKTHAIG